MELAAWVSLATVCIFGALTPGPSLIVILKHTIGGGRINGIVASLGQAMGVASYATITVLGLAIVIEQSPMLFNTIRYISIVFILYLAYQSLTSKSALGRLGHEKVDVTLWQSFSEGLMIAFVNPKLAIFFLALFSQFITQDASVLQNAIMVLTVGGIDLLWYSILACLMSTPALINRLRDNINVVEKITGVALLTVAARVAL